MGGFYNSKFLISKASLDALRKKREEVADKILELESSITISNIPEKLRQLISLEKVILDNALEIQKLTNDRITKSGFWNSISGVTEISPESRQKIQIIQQKQFEVNEKIKNIGGSSLREQNHKLNQIGVQNAFLEKLDKRIKQLEEKKHKIDSLRNKAATITQEKRVIAESVKKRIGKNQQCPYCGSYISGIPHADHIYPVSRGGESVVKNMVYVCSSCNLKKGNMTLTMFIKKFSLNRVEIESRLDALRKEY